MRRATAIRSDLKIEAIAAALEKHSGRRGKAARDMGMDRTTLCRKIKRLGMVDHREAAKVSASQKKKSGGKTLK